ncbi:MAG: protein kinase [Sandaracinaceae bacterium]|nr:protein kinase [Sandaracinaceae bacterium]
MICGPLAQHGPSPRATATNPVVLLEVTSDSSEEYDTGEKWKHYATIPSLRDYVVVSHRERRITVHSRGEDGQWSTRAAITGGGGDGAQRRGGAEGGRDLPGQLDPGLMGAAAPRPAAACHPQGAMMPAFHSLVGRRVDRYEVLAQLGQGGFGAVYRARHAMLGTEVALKVLWPERADDPGAVERFMREARAAASIGSPHIVRVGDAGTTADGVVFLAMELLHGHDLERELRARRRLSPYEASDILRQVLAALGAAHAAGIVHRDLKPANVFLVPGPDGAPFVKLLDFGVSKMKGARSLTGSGIALGTPQYMAPEQIEGAREIDGRVDVYAAGCMLYEMLSGRLPFEGSGVELLVRRLSGERPPELRSIAPDVPRRSPPSCTARSPSIATRASRARPPWPTRCSPRRRARRPRGRGHRAAGRALGDAGLAPGRSLRADRRHPRGPRRGIASVVGREAGGLGERAVRRAPHRGERRCVSFRAAAAGPGAGRSPRPRRRRAPRGGPRRARRAGAGARGRRGRARRRRLPALRARAAGAERFARRGALRVARGARPRARSARRPRAIAPRPRPPRRPSIRPASATRSSTSWGSERAARSTRCSSARGPASRAAPRASRCTSRCTSSARSAGTSRSRARASSGSRTTWRRRGASGAPSRTRAPCASAAGRPRSWSSTWTCRGGPEAKAVVRRRASWIECAP